MKTINEVYAGKSFKEIADGLEALGALCEGAKLLGESLTAQDRAFILSVREAATRYGLSRKLQASIEFNGAITVRKGARS
jgi:hypothetical protein